MAKAARKQAAPAAVAAEAEWELRPWVLAGLLALAGLLVHLASDDGAADTVPWRMALTALCFFGPLAAAFTIERDRLVAPGIFAGVVGLVMAGIAWRATSAGDHYSDEQFWVATGVISVGLALPLFQAGAHRLRLATPYREVHFHVWTDALSGAGALAFTGISWALLAILNQLFQLVGIELIEQLMEHGWFGWMFSGAAFGAGLGTLRNQLKILGTLQMVATLVLSILAVPLALGLLVFVVALVATGGEALWDATDSATPVLLACAVGAFGLANAILRDGDEDMSKNRVLRYAALVLALAILPLTVFAAISIGVRIGQHGLSPERLWGLVAVAVAVAYGLAYLVAVVRGRKAGWRDQVRRANLHLAAGTCAVAFILALPIFNFGAISANNQLARLERGAVSAEEFDYDALRWDFGDAGNRALERLAKGDNAEVAKFAKEALESNERLFWPRDNEAAGERDKRFANLRLQVEDPPLRAQAEDYVRRSSDVCNAPCVVLDLGPTADGSAALALVEGSWVRRLGRNDRGVYDENQVAPMQPAPEPLAKDSTVEVRPWNGRQVYVDGKPVGQPFE